MTSTRNHNQKSDYVCKKKEIEKTAQYHVNPIFAEPSRPSQSFVLGANPTKISANNLSHNAVDIESTLRGIRSCDLEGKPFQATLKKKDYYTVELFENHLTNNIFVPRPFYHNSEERVGFHNI
tara:strand:+ start:1196 stop:1564 length:369 start_codon:yes stop_codon:yes gene_type:complete